MPKTNSATIRLVLKKNRKNKNGEYPIYIVVCFNGRMEKATKVSCLEKNWDAKNETVKKSQNNYAVLNKILSDTKQKVIEKKNKYEYEGKVYTPAMLLDDEKDVTPKNDYKELMDGLINERQLKPRTVTRYLYSYRKLHEFFGRDFVINEITLKKIKQFKDWLQVEDGTKGDMIRCVSAVFNFAIMKNVIEEREYPFREFKTSKLRYKSRDYFLEPSHIKRLMGYFLNLVIVKENGTWKYREGAVVRLHLRYSMEFSILWFLLCYKFNGSAPIEIAKLRVEDCKMMKIEGEDYWAIDFKRQKTQTDVHIRLKRDIFTLIAVEHYLQYSKTFVYPIVNVKNADYDAVNNCSAILSGRAIKRLRKALSEINEQIIKDNEENGCEEPLIETDKVVLYTARHSFASHYVNSPNATIGGLATLLARSPNTIATYVHQLTQNKDIADMTKNMPI